MSENQEIKEEFYEDIRKCEVCGAYIDPQYSICGDCADKLFPQLIEDEPTPDEIDRKAYEAHLKILEAIDENIEDDDDRLPDENDFEEF